MAALLSFIGKRRITRASHVRGGLALGFIFMREISKPKGLVPT